MQRVGGVLSLLVVASLLLAGCAGSDGGAEGKDAGDGSEEEVTNAIEGTVQGDDLLPLEMAKVEILSLNVSVMTNSEGNYRFTNLAPRDYLVVASKDGYRTLTQRAIVKDQSVHQLDFKLDAKPLIEPFKETVDHAGRIACKIVYGTDPEAMEHHDCGQAADDINNDPDHEFQIGPNAAQILVEAFWEPTSDGSKHLTLTVESVGFGHQDLVFSSISGPSGIRVTIPQTIVEKYYPEGGALRTTMAAGASITGDEAGADAGAAIQQDFVLYVTTFYVEPGSPGFTANPEG
jgi:hypothetical protein